MPPNGCFRLLAAVICHWQKEGGMQEINLLARKNGQGLVEYALILVLIAVLVILILSFVGSQVNSTFSKIGSTMSP
jgi:pilus assembly protein Flp/PilA